MRDLTKEELYAARQLKTIWGNKCRAAMSLTRVLLTQAMAAEAIGISQPTFCDLLNGKKPITPMMAVRLGTYFNVDPRHFRPDYAFGDMALLHGLRHVLQDVLEALPTNVLDKALEAKALRAAYGRVQPIPAASRSNPNPHPA